jgi:hypothetical protein
MLDRINKAMKQKPQTQTTGLFHSVMSLVLQGKSNAAIKAALPDTSPQILSVYIASCKVAIQSDNFFAALKRMKVAK